MFLISLFTRFMWNLIWDFNFYNQIKRRYTCPFFCVISDAFLLYITNIRWMIHSWKRTDNQGHYHNQIVSKDLNLSIQHKLIRLIGNFINTLTVYHNFDLRINHCSDFNNIYLLLKVYIIYATHMYKGELNARGTNYHSI